MNRNTTYALFGVTFAIVAGMVGTNLPFLQSTGMAEKTSTSADADGIKILGHVTSVIKDSDGNIKAYRQTDNVVVNSGKNCASRLLFGGPSGARGSGSGLTVCTGALTAPWNVIGIGNNTINAATGVDQSNFTLSHESTTSGNSFNGRTVGSVTYTNSTGSSGSATALIQATFGPVSGIRSAGLYVVSSGLFNNTSQASPNAGGLFAAQTISPLLINNGDSLTIKWTVNVG